MDIVEPRQPNPQCSDSPVDPFDPFGLARARRLYRLHENLIDLEVELRDLSDEIASRTDRLAVVLAMLYATRCEIAALEAHDR